MRRAQDPHHVPREWDCRGGEPEQPREEILILRQKEGKHVAVRSAQRCESDSQTSWTVAWIYRRRACAFACWGRAFAWDGLLPALAILP